MAESTETQPISTGDPVTALVSGWKRFWQAPAFLLAIGLLSTGVVTAIVTAPEPNVSPILDRAEQLIDRGANQDAIGLLNGRVYPWLDKPGYVKPHENQRYHVLIARAIAYGQLDLGLKQEENYQAVIREFHEAESMGATLGPKDLYALSDAYVAMGQTKKALLRAAQIQPGQRALKDRIFSRVIDGWLNSKVPKYDDALGLLTEMLTDPNLPTEKRVWALSRRAQVQLGQGFADEAITRLLRAMPRLEGTSKAGLAELALQLGRGYLKVGAIREAQEQFERVQNIGTGQIVAMATVYLGKVFETRGQLVEARDLFASVVEQEVGGAAHFSALLGLGEVESRLRSTPQALEAYAELVEGLRADPDLVVPSVERVVESLLSRHLEQMSLGEYPVALRYAGMASDLYSDFEDRPAAIILALANGHASSADALMGELGEEPVRVLASLEPSTRAEAQRHLIRAAAHYRDHADRYLLEDIAVYSDSLWKSGDLYDRAGDQSGAIEAFREYAESNPGGLRHAEARFRLGRAYQAMGEFGLASDWYQGLIDDAKDDRNEAGGFAVKSYVPLAQCYLFDDDPENDSEAETLLIAAVNGTIGQTLASQFHEALIELGSLYYRSGRYERAIERLGEALARGQSEGESAGLTAGQISGQMTTVVYRLADSHRLLADEIEQSLQEAMPDRERLEREQSHVTHRRTAMALYSKARDSIEGMSRYDQTSLDRLQLRNSYFYLGDCAFDLGDFDAAIRYYDAARERYPSDPASLVAMVQIVNAHVEQGDLGRARTANERARRFYMSLPESAWDDPNLPMDREDWKRWLDSSALLYEVAEGG